MKKITIIIVDDHALVRDTWALLLTSSGKYEIIGKTGDGNEAIEMARSKRPDIALIDINMPSLNGFEVLKQIRKFSPGTRVIAVSMHSQPAYAKKMIREGAKAYVTKNSSGDEFLFAINEVVNGRQYLCKEVKTILAEQEFSDTAETGIKNLSKREMEIIELIRDGHSSKKIASKLYIDVRTVEVHRHNILKKLKVKNSAALIQYINDHGL
jgi:DNA-binding NarL/FixJ family response regulator